MREIRVYAFEVLGEWQITAAYREVSDTADTYRQDLYRSTAGVIDDEDPEFILLQLVDQLRGDLVWYRSTNRDGRGVPR